MLAQQASIPVGQKRRLADVLTCGCDLLQIPAFVRLEERASNGDHGATSAGVTGACVTSRSISGL